MRYVEDVDLFLSVVRKILIRMNFAIQNNGLQSLHYS
jgi:hypothetical protein